MIAPLMLRMLLIWLPRWKCSRLRQSPMPLLAEVLEGVDHLAR